ncbi:helix-turn-helix domain-containing protein [Streptomyces sp. NPDC021224]|uniref:helix-turn-helix domain-containing protein n=1 Tax=unclassified Streptomyces TaxID=2593676 RepID=UPI00379E1F7B
MVEDEEADIAVRRALSALDAVEAIPDPIAQVRAIGQLLKDQTERNRRFYDRRRELVLALRAENVSYRKIATELGVSLGTVQDIERGAGRWVDREKRQPGRS